MMLEWTDQQEPSIERIRMRYRHFGAIEARGVSPLYAEFAETVAESPAALHFIAVLPTARQQPNLVFAAVRHLFGTPASGAQLVDLIARHPEPIRSVILARRTQTNEPARCAVLLPALSLLPQPLALLEVGASAGLCLLPDSWGYDYGRRQLGPTVQRSHPAPIFPCDTNAATPLPEGIPTIAWRAGLDLNPIDLHDPDACAWLETLVWPGQHARAERLRAAIHVAQEHPPPVFRGDLVTDLTALAATAPPDATLVVFHTAVLAYVSAADRARFRQAVRDLGAVWISNEGPQVLPDIAAMLNPPPPPDKFLLAVNGNPVAITGPHGQSIEWIC